MKCIECGTEAGLGGKRGILPRYCSNACRQRAYRRRRRENRIPERLTRLDRWVRADDKRPIQINGKSASTTKPATWSSFADVEKSTAGNGRGIMLGDGIVCIDLDDALRAGQPTKTAQAVLDACPGAWVEISQSGRGLHVFGAGFERAGQRFRTADGTGVEIYTTNRFILVTGQTYRPGGLPVLDLDGVAAVARKS